LLDTEYRGEAPDVETTSGNRPAIPAADITGVLDWVQLGLRAFEAAKDLENSPGDQQDLRIQGCGMQLRAAIAFFSEMPATRGMTAPLEELQAALANLEDGGKPALLAPKRGETRPPSKNYDAVWGTITFIIDQWVEADAMSSQAHAEREIAKICQSVSINNEIGKPITKDVVKATSAAVRREAKSARPSLRAKIYLGLKERADYPDTNPTRAKSWGKEKLKTAIADP